MYDILRVPAGERDLYYVSGCLRLAISGGDSLLSQSKKTTQASTDQFTTPHQDILTALLGGGLPSVAKGYLDNVLIPTVTNNATVMGLGRSGAVTEAIANTAWQPGFDLIKLLLGMPLVRTQQTQTQRQRAAPGSLDVVSSLLGLTATGLDIFNQFSAAFPSASTPIPATSPSLDSFPLTGLFGGAEGT